MTDEAMSPVPADDPLMIAWEAYKDTPEFQNTERWAAKPEHTLGSLWAAFEQGFRRARLSPGEPSGEARDRIMEAICDLEGEAKVMGGSFDPAQWKVEVSVSDLLAALAPPVGSEAKPELVDMMARHAGVKGDGSWTFNDPAALREIPAALAPPSPGGGDGLEPVAWRYRSDYWTGSQWGVTTVDPGTRPPAHSGKITVQALYASPPEAAAEIEALRAAVAELERANQALAAKRSRATYLCMVDVDKASDELLALDAVRVAARQALQQNGEG